MTGNRLEEAPAASRGFRNRVHSAWVADDHDIQWTFTYEATGRYVTGYTLVPRQNPIPQTITLTKKHTNARIGN